MCWFALLEWRYNTTTYHRRRSNFTNQSRAQITDQINPILLFNLFTEQQPLLLATSSHLMGGCVLSKHSTNSPSPADAAARQEQDEFHFRNIP